ncbi:DNA polymerase III subunit delta [Lactobacillus xylocopicola]|uniref:DNA polymerase III subunit delta n=1 Tax=Lactobacillus xylocopicola TaxID=2976676 RepID=A0ABN6SN22_9LACO|nr:DNA polymerase III subunit delta [Lactobacillus xylocopicola]BDR60432.1 DNA polymerase III subunit delta [Lactobacillus xylocopicola]
MTLLSLFKNTNSNNSHTLITGDDDFLNDYLARSYTREKTFAKLDHVTVDCESDGLAELIADLTESSLFSDQKVITVKHPFFLTARVAQKYQQQLAQLERILANSDRLEDIIVLVASDEKIDRRKKLTKTVLRQFNVVDTHVKPYEVEKVTRQLIAAEGYQLPGPALQLLLERSDHILDTVLSNLQKLKMLAVDGQISVEAVKRNVDLSMAQNVFAILEAALKHNYQEAVERLENQLQEGSNPAQLLAVFENQLELILVVKILQARGRSEGQITKELGVHPYRVKLSLQNGLSVAKLATLLEQAIKLDFGYKSGQYRDSNFLQLFVLSV